jgi:organic radical activating enzyme
MIEMADEVRLLVDREFDESKIPNLDTFLGHVFLSPINDENTVRRENVQLCLELLQTHPTWRVSVQVHKFLGLR